MRRCKGAAIELSALPANYRAQEVSRRRIRHEMPDEQHQKDLEIHLQDHYAGAVSAVEQAEKVETQRLVAAEVAFCAS